MSSSPAWLTIALTSLSSCTTPSPTEILSTGIRSLPPVHILHHLNRWARYVWRPAVTSHSLSTLTRSPDEPQLLALGPGAVALLAALVEAVRRCNADEWTRVLGVMFLADDPWAVEVGRAADPDGVDRAAAVMDVLYRHKSKELAEAAANLSSDVRDAAHELGMDGNVQGESFAELRCRVAALQLQLDDVTAVVRRNEKNTKDLLSSFHFWSMLLLSELRSYKSQLGERSVGGNGVNGGQSVASDHVLENFSRTVGNAVNGLGGEGGVPDFAMDRFGLPRRDASLDATAPSEMPRPKPKRVFRDGKWVIL